MASDVTFSPAEFKQLPLDYIISAPLLTTIKAHAMATRTTLEFIKELAGQNEDFEITRVKQSIGPDGNPTGPAQKDTIKISAPLLALANTPSMNFDSLSVNFEYTISQVYTDKTNTQSNFQGKIGGSPWLSKFVDIGLSGGVTRTRGEENTINKSGTLDIKLHVSQGPTPPGLSRIVTAMTQGISDLLENDVAAPAAPARGGRGTGGTT